MSLEGVLRAIRRCASSCDDDWSDWLSHSVTSNLALAAATLVSYKIFVDSPIECLPPSFFPDSWIVVS
ncbi:unnamed protein product [Heligmosomoides polygyrus]|uniref:Pecanex-like protein n=1 Tax=Heligmosomoides polygyrus TaxID=6339 RepID=A0A183FFL3_HELPZ|nr:unnamed protein product [Heligmosomoides polygyrus]